MSRIVFYCHDTMENIGSLEYYRQDIEALRGLGHEVIVCNRYRDIPWNFDLLFVWWWTFALLPVALARLAGRKTAIAGVYNFRFEDQTSGTDFFARPWYQRWLISLATRLAHANLFTSHREFEEVADHFGLRTAHYSPCAVGEDYFELRARNEGRSLLLNLAWSAHSSLQRKGVWTIVEAAALLRQRGRDFEMILAGKRGDGFGALCDRVRELGLERWVRVVGEVSQEEKLDLFARTRLYLQPSRFEGFGLATAEAAAAGACVITTDVGEVRMVVGDGAIYVEPGDAEGLADAVESLLADPDLAHSIDARAIERIRRLYSIGGKRANFAAILESLGISSRTYD
ncbi:glycosyltransferase family 4 protein [Qipengyuania sp.]|uniref:glycosyltransferase family 4 protein n=1 Tax=Qipengyuania sp. TaxID=2004515 RepID=UPI0035C87E00